MPCDIRREGWQSMSKKRTGGCTQSNALGNVTHSDTGRFIRVAHKRRYGCSRRRIRCFISSICCQRINSSQKLKQSIKLQLAWWNIDRICVWPGVSVTPEKCVMPTSYAISGTPFKSLPVKRADKEKLTTPTIGASCGYWSQNQSFCFPWLWETRAVKSLTGQSEMQS